MSKRARELLILILTTLILPLAVLGLGLWQQQRAPAHETETLAERQRIAAVLVDFEAATRSATPGEIPWRAQIRKDGRVYVGAPAVEVVRGELSRLDRAILISKVRRHLPPVVIVCAALVFALSLLMLVTSISLGWAGRRSRAALERGFDLVRRALPLALGMQVVLTAIGVVAAIAFEIAPLIELDDPGTNEFKLLALAVAVMAFSLWTAGKAVFNLRNTLAHFQPNPLEISGRSISPAQAPGLWRWIDGLADRLGALGPDQIVVGLTRGFFVTSGPKLLSPGGERLEGRTLYLPLPYLPLLRQDEAEAIIGHELGHFTGGDTEYSLRFLPIYAGVNRSLAAMVLAGRGRDGSDGLITRPAVELGLFAMERFDRAVLHWSRLREFAADEAGARITSAEAAGRALLRTSAVEARIGETLAEAFQHPETAPADLIAATLDHARDYGLDDPSEFREERQPHPTDTHPPTHQRLAALGVTLTPALLADVMSAPAAGALVRTSALFAAPDQLYRDLTGDFVESAREAHRAHRVSLETAAGAVSSDEVVVRDSGGAAGWFITPAGLLLGAMAIGAKLQEPQFPEGANLIAGVTGAIALLIIFYGVKLLIRGEKPFVTLRPQTIALDGVDRPLRWAEIERVGYYVVGPATKTQGLRFSVFLKPDAPLPGRAKGARRAKIKHKQNMIEIGSMRFRNLTALEFVELIDQYRVAETARTLLGQQSGVSSATEVAQHISGNGPRG
ncbi:M48 family metallopeptidase [Bosea sp. LjRoot9]|uniref:M48 family metalloprotease n=1 Tax=Bosea sp. LjRoot9 TaxID=3342341 RepID=UPI003ED0AC7B